MIHAVTVAMVTGIMAEQAGESEGSRGEGQREKGMEMERIKPGDDLGLCVLERRSSSNTTSNKGDQIIYIDITFVKY